MTSPALSSAATPRRWGLPRGLIVLLGGAAIVISGGELGVRVRPLGLRGHLRGRLRAIAARRGAWPTEPRAHDPHVT